MVQFSRVVGNIVINADQAMPEGGVIRLTVENLSVRDGQNLPLQPADYVRISIEDQGLGMDADTLSKIFDPYFTTRSQGSGLGLYAAYSIMKSHDGLITVESTPGTGSIASCGPVSGPGRRRRSRAGLRRWAGRQRNATQSWSAAGSPSWIVG